VAPAVFDYMVRLASHTRQMPQLRLGASPRGALGLLRTSRVYAALRGRPYVVPGDVQTLAEPVLAHRILMSPSFEASGGTVADAVAEAIASVPAPPTDQHR
jgi:MoxR-like ATPase